MTLTFKILYGLYLENPKVKKADTCRETGLGVDVQWHNVTLV